MHFAYENPPHPSGLLHSPGYLLYVGFPEGVAPGARRIPVLQRYNPYSMIWSHNRRATPKIDTPGFFCAILF